MEAVVYSPDTEAGRQELAMRVAAVHAEAVNRKLEKLACPARQKRQLLEAVIHTVKERRDP